MIGTANLLFLPFAILATAQNAEITQILNTAAFSGGIPPSNTGPVTIPLATTVTSDGQPIVQTTGFTTIYPLFANSSTSTLGQIDLTTPSPSLSLQTITATNSSVLSTVLSGSSNSTGLPATPGESVSSSFSTLISSANASSSGTDSPFTSSSVTIGEPSSSTIGPLTNTSLVLPTDVSASGSSSASPGESSSVSLSVSTTSVSDATPTGSSVITPTGSSVITPTDSSIITPTDSSATIVLSGQPTTTPPPATTTTSYSDEEIESYLSKTSWDNYAVSSTITDDPTISASQTSNSEWKKNFWMHTTIDGQPTDLPVVHCGCVCKNNCNDDDDDDDWPALWVIFFKVPKVPNVQISLPKYPDFHLGGCIKIKVPIINIEIPLGKCPPVSDNGQHGHSDPDDPGNKNKEPDPEDPDDPEPSDTPTQTPSSGQESSTSSSSSSSSCSSAVVTDYLTHISCPTTGASATQCATAIETGTRSGCSLVGTASVTVSASAPAAACARQSWPTAFGPGVAYSEPGFEYGTYVPPDIFGSLTVSFISMSVSDSSGMNGPITGASSTASFSSITVSDSSGMTGPTTGASVTTVSTAGFSSMTAGDSSGMTGPNTRISSTELSTVTSSSAGTATPTPTDGSSAVSRSASVSGIPSGTPSNGTSPSSTGGHSTSSDPVDCEDTTSQWWVDPESMKNGISDFCDDASQATGWDDGVGRVNSHKRIEHVYNNDTDKQVVFLVSSTNSDLDNAFKQIKKDDCNSNMTRIFDECPPGLNIPGLDWRHGGALNDTNSGLYWVIVTDRPKYHPGTCTFLVEEGTYKNKDDTSEQHWGTRTSITDSEKNVITPLGDQFDDLYNAPYKTDADRGINEVPGLYSKLNISASFNGGNGDRELHFTVGNYQFSAQGSGSDESEVPRCDVGEWDVSAPQDDPYQHAYRKTNCTVYC